MEKINKSEVIQFKVRPGTKRRLKELAKIHDRPMTGVIEQLIKKECKELGLLDFMD